MSTELILTDGRSVVATGWTTPGNTTAEDGVYATAAPAQNGVISSLFTFPASAIPAGATIRSVSAILKWKVSTAASVGILNVILYNDADSSGGGSDATEPLADKTTTFSYLDTPSLADLLVAGQLGVLVEAQHGNSATAITFSLDYVALLIDYSEAQDNDLADLRTQLETALRDPGNVTWSTDELDKLLTWACARMWPKIARRIREDVTLIADTEQYTLTDVAEVNRVDLVDADGLRMYQLVGGSWEFWGDGEVAGGTLFINRGYSDANNTLRVHGWGPYDLTTNFPKDRHVQLVLALARAEAARREIARRMNFTDWQATNQVQNISANELVLMVNEADAEARSLFNELKTWRRPVPARV